MAKVIVSFSKNRFKYDWPTWMNGKIYRATKGEDFDCEPLGFARTLYSKAYHSERRVSVSIHGNAVEFQFKSA